MTALHLVTDEEEKALVSAADSGGLNERLICSVLLTLGRQVRELQRQVKELQHCQSV